MFLVNWILKTGLTNLQSIVDKKVRFTFNDISDTGGGDEAPTDVFDQRCQVEVYKCGQGICQLPGNCIILTIYGLLFHVFLCPLLLTRQTHRDHFVCYRCQRQGSI